MQLHVARLCLECQEVHDQQTCPACSSESQILSQVFAGQNVGVTQVGDRIWLVTFMDYDLGYFGDETCRLEPTEENPFGPKVLLMCSE